MSLFFKEYGRGNPYNDFCFEIIRIQICIRENLNLGGWVVHPRVALFQIELLELVCGRCLPPGGHSLAHPTSRPLPPSSSPIETSHTPSAKCNEKIIVCRGEVARGVEIQKKKMWWAPARYFSPYKRTRGVRGSRGTYACYPPTVKLDEPFVFILEFYLSGQLSFCT